MLAHRNVSKFFHALRQKQHYVALGNMIRLYPNFPGNLMRYLTGRGSYPYVISVRTPTGPISVKLDSFHDLLTVNEIFCRQDYFADSKVGYVVDLGSNIGVSALYFLTRNRFSTCTLYEPDPRNTEKLKSNLRGFEQRFELVQAAVSDESGQLEFGIETSGRYGGIGVNTGRKIVVNCVHINDALELALRGKPKIDILKLDTEGVEIQTVKAIKPELIGRISTIYLEAEPNENLHSEQFRNRQYGSVRQLTIKAPA